MTWHAKVAKSLKRDQSTSAIRVAWLKHLIKKDDRDNRAKNPKAAVTWWLKTLRIPEEGIVDMFVPKRWVNGNQLSMLVKVKTEHVPVVERASGVGGFHA